MASIRDSIIYHGSKGILAAKLASESQSQLKIFFELVKNESNVIADALKDY